MTALKIITGADNETLRTKSKPVKRMDKKTKKLIANMAETLLEQKGLGLAAPQVGVNLRIFIARLNAETPNETVVTMINPELLVISKDTEDGEEGCLSLPNKFGIVRRAKSVTIQYSDQRGSANALNLNGLNARIMQHEIDHLEGILIVDKLQREINPADLKTNPAI